MGYPVVHFEINTASQSDLARFYEEAFGWTTHADGDDYLQINTNGVCAGTGEPGIEGGIGPSDPGDDFVTSTSRCRTWKRRSRRWSSWERRSTCPQLRRDASSSGSSATRTAIASASCGADERTGKPRPPGGRHRGRWPGHQQPARSRTRACRTRWSSWPRRSIATASSPARLRTRARPAVTRRSRQPTT
jgi:hypothetical protein